MTQDTETTLIKTVLPAPRVEIVPRDDGRQLARKTVGNDKLSSSYLTGNQTITLSGDASGSGATAITVTVANGAITLAKLASGVSPSHVAKFAGTVTWSGSGATLASTVTGVAASDIVMATITVKPSQAAYLVRAVPSSNTITFELSAANTSNDAQISYVVFRAAS